MAVTRGGPLLLGTLAAGAAAAMVAALAFGSVSLGPADWLAALRGDDALAATLLFELRLPRVLTAFTVGALLALAGALMQVLLRNPLADPYILGVSGGAATAALLGMLAGLSAAMIQGLAFAGAAGSAALVFVLAHTGGRRSTQRLLLTGVVVAAGWGALISFVLSIAPHTQLPGMLFWLMGDVSGSRAGMAHAAVLVLASLAAVFMARPLNVLMQGETQAAALGVPVERVRLALYFLSTLLTAAAVTLAGSIGFVGLVVPHAARLLGGADHRWLLPASVLMGGGLLVLADTLARSLWAPQQLPVGVITALLGVPLFLWLMRHEAGR